VQEVLVAKAGGSLVMSLLAGWNRGFYYGV
jgi:hypothetical protein